jgi:hypothetical protein
MSRPAREELRRGLLAVLLLALLASPGTAGAADADKDSEALLPAWFPGFAPALKDAPPFFRDTRLLLHFRTYYRNNEASRTPPRKRGPPAAGSPTGLAGSRTCSRSARPATSRCRSTPPPTRAATGRFPCCRRAPKSGGPNRRRCESTASWPRTRCPSSSRASREGSPPRAVPASSSARGWGRGRGRRRSEPSGMSRRGQVRALDHGLHHVFPAAVLGWMRGERRGGSRWAARAMRSKCP